MSLFAIEIRVKTRIIDMATEWTDEKNELFREMRAPTVPGNKPVSVGDMALYFGTTVGAIRAHSLNLNIKLIDRKPWDSEVEIARLIEMDDADMSVAAIARDLGRTPGSVQWKLEDIGRKSARQRRPDQDDTALHEAAAKLARPLTGKEAADLAIQLNRPVEAVRRRLVDLGYQIKARAFPWSDDQLENLRLASVRGDTLTQAAASVGRSASSTRAMADRLDLEFAVFKIELDAGLVRKVGKIFENEPATSIRAVATEIGLDPRRTKALARAAGVNLSVRARSKPAPVTKEILDGFIAEGKSLTTVAQLLHRDFRTMKKLASDLGVVFPVYSQTHMKPKADRRRVRPSVIRAQAPQKSKAAKVKSAASAKSKPNFAYRKASDVVRKVEINLDPAPLREKVEVKVSVKSSFGRFMPSAAKSKEVIDQNDVDEAVRRFIAARGLTKQELSPADQAVTTIRRLGYSVVSRGSGWILDDRIQIASVNELVDFAQAKAARMASMKAA
jgi:hypothetical protein